MFDMKYFLKCASLFFIAYLAFFIETRSQTDYYELTGARKGYIDTLSKETSQRLTDEAQGILEKEIDPKHYFVGPGDAFHISVVAVEPITYEATVSPLGVLILPYAGAADLKGKNLEQAIETIKTQLKKVYKTDEIFVTLRKIRKFKISVAGEVMKPSIVPATAAERVSELIEKAGGATSDASMRKIKVLRSNPEDTLRADLMKYFFTADKSANPFVNGGDFILVPRIDENSTIKMFGEVKKPIEVEFVEGDRLSDLAKFCKGFLESAFLDSVEFARFSSETGDLTIKYIDLSSWDDRLITADELLGDFALKSGDRFYVRKKRDWRQSNYVAVGGAINFPGRYPIENDKERVFDIIRRAGGLKTNASLESAFLTRWEYFNIEDLEMNRLANMKKEERSEEEEKYYRARANERKGVVSINFSKIIRDPNSPDNIVVMKRDSIYIPTIKEFVNVQGRVNKPGMVQYEEGLTYLDYIERAGGYGYQADEDGTLLVKGNGSRYLADKMDYVIEPGDNLLVPPKEEISFMDVFSTSLTIATQIVTIIAVVAALSRN